MFPKQTQTEEKEDEKTIAKRIIFHSNKIKEILCERQEKKRVMKISCNKNNFLEAWSDNNFVEKDLLSLFGTKQECSLYHNNVIFAIVKILPLVKTLLVC